MGACRARLEEERQRAIRRARINQTRAAEFRHRRILLKWWVEGWREEGELGFLRFLLVRFGLLEAAGLGVRSVDRTSAWLTHTPSPTRVYIPGVDAVESTPPARLHVCLYTLRFLWRPL